MRGVILEHVGKGHFRQRKSEGPGPELGFCLECLRKQESQCNWSGGMRQGGGN